MFESNSRSRNEMPKNVRWSDKKGKDLSGKVRTERIGRERASYIDADQDGQDWVHVPSRKDSRIGKRDRKRDEDLCLGRDIG